MRFKFLKFAPSIRSCLVSPTEYRSSVHHAGWGSSSFAGASRDDDQAEQQAQENRAPDHTLPNPNPSHTSPPHPPFGGAPDTEPPPQPAIPVVAVVSSPLMAPAGAILSPGSPSWQLPLTQLPSPQASAGFTPPGSLEASAAFNLASPPRSVDCRALTESGLDDVGASAELPSWCVHLEAQILFFPIHPFAV